jgi:hypothetical protein
MTRRAILRFATLLAFGFAIIGVMPSSAYAQASHQTQFVTEDISFEAPSCTGEMVLITGTVEDVFQTTIDPNGGVHIEQHFTPHLTAIGETSGDVYRAVGPARITFYDAVAPSIINGVNIIRLIAPGSGDNLLAKEIIRLVIDANGEVHIDLYVPPEVTAVCRG